MTGIKNIKNMTPRELKEIAIKKYISLSNQRIGVTNPDQFRLDAYIKKRYLSQIERQIRSTQLTFIHAL